MEGRWFCDREAETALLVSRMTSGIHVFVLSPRRYGKTSLFKRARGAFRDNGGRCAYANLLLATSEVEVAQAIVQAVVRDLLGPGSRARHSLEEVLRHLRFAPKVNVGPDGSVSIGLDPAVVGDSWLGVITDAIEVLRRAGGHDSAPPASLVLDEFQVVANIGRGGIGGAFKVLADEASGVSIVFSGSHLAVMEQLTKGQGAPLHGMGERLVLDVIDQDEMVPFLQRRAGSAGKRLAATTGRLIYQSAEAVPNYVQQLALAAFEAAGAEATIEDGHVEQGFETIVERQASAYAQAFEDLGSAPVQQRILKALAAKPTSAVYGRAFLEAVGGVNANAVTTALRSLDGRELVSRKARVWDVADPFLRRWLLQGAA